MRLLVVIAAAGLPLASVCAQTPPEQILVNASPLPGSGVTASTLPSATVSLGATDIDRTGIPSLTGTILDIVPGASVTDTDGNVFQPDIQFRGFTASPVAGTTQGLAVYVNGARFNDPFGDTVNWDLIPAVAIAQTDLQTANPIFGLNALGGSIDVHMKNGFTFDRADATAYGGSFGRAAGIAEFGRRDGDVAVYAAGQILNDGGYRRTSATRLYQLYTDLGWRRGGTELHLAITGADNTLGNPGATPIQALAANPAAIFTAPNEVYNKYVGVNLNGTTALDDATTLQGVAYFQNLTQRIVNGITTQISPCGGGLALLCNPDGSLATGRDGQPIPDYRHGGPYAADSLQGTDSHAYGASAQAAADRRLAGHPIHALAGGSFDGSTASFTASTQLGGFDTSDNTLIGPGIPLSDPTPVHVVTTTRDYALFASARIGLARGIDLTLAGRFNNVEEDLHDKLGGPVVGQHSYNRFNPSLGATWQIRPSAQLYAQYAETNRAPTPTELSCASAANPCTLLNFFVGDPNLKQVVAKTWDLGARGNLGAGGGARLRWDADYFHSKNKDDLIYQATTYNPNLSFYTNAGTTLRQGVEANLRLNAGRLHASLGYAFIDATFRTPLLLNSGNNPAANAHGQEQVRPGDHLPGIPQHRATLVVDWRVTKRWTMGASVLAQSGQYRFGDEANLTQKLGGYATLNLNTEYALTEHVTVFGLVDNVTDTKYQTYGVFGPVTDIPWPSVPGGVTDPREASPGAPIAGYGGVRYVF